MLNKLNFCFIFLIITLFSFSAFGQNSIYRTCPGTTALAKVEIDSKGNINLVPCPSKTYLFNGQPLNLNAIGQLNGLNGYSQTFAFGNAGTTPGWVSSGTVHTFNIPTASATNTGLMTPSMFNKYEAASAGYTGLATNALPLWNGTTFNNSQFSQAGTGYASTLRVNGQTIVLGDALASGNNRTVTISDIASNTLAVVGASNFNGNVTVNGTLNATNFSFGNQTANTFFAAPTGASGAATFRSIVAADIPNLPASIITSGNFALARLGTGTPTNTTYLRGDGTWAPVTAGSVTSVDLALPSIFTVSGNPVTSSGTLTAVLNSQAQNTIFAAPSTGAGVPVFRVLAAADLPAHSAALLTSGQIDLARLGTGTPNSTNFLRGDGTFAQISPPFRPANDNQENVLNTLTNADNGKLIFLNSGTAILPASPTPGLNFKFFKHSGSSTINNVKINIAGQNLWVNNSQNTTNVNSTLTVTNGGSFTMTYSAYFGWIVTDQNGTITYTP